MDWLIPSPYRAIELERQNISREREWERETERERERERSASLYNRRRTDRATI